MAEPVGDGDGVLGHRAGQGGEPSLPHGDAGRRVHQIAPGGHGRTRALDLGVQRQDADDPAGRHMALGELVGRLGERAERSHQEQRVPVEGDELADRDHAVHRVVRAPPGDEGDEHARQQELGALQSGVHRRHPHSGSPHPLGLLAVAVGEDLLAADAAQHPEARDDVGGPGGEVTLEVALLVLPPVQGPEQRADGQRHQRDAEQHHQAELR